MARTDLRGLKLTPAQVESLSNVNVTALFQPPDDADLRTWLRSFRVFWRSTLGLMLLSGAFRILFHLSPAVVLLRSLGIVAVDVGLPTLGLDLGLICSLAAVHQVFWIQRTRGLRVLMRLMAEVERYNSLVKAVEINDQLEEAGNPGMDLSHRQQVLEGLSLTREDLVRAFKTERILRENRQFIATNTQLFTDNLAALTSLQVREQASEQGRLLNEALQIAVEVQQEMRGLSHRIPFDPVSLNR